MNRVVQAKIQESVGSLPAYAVTHPNDCSRLYNVAIAVWHAGKGITNAQAVVRDLSVFGVEQNM